MTEQSPPVKIGRLNDLDVVSEASPGVYLDGGPFGDILLPRAYVPEGCRLGDRVKVFLYLDSEDRFVATTQTPYAMAGELAYLEAVAVTPIGAFMDWGLTKDLLVPIREQKQKVVKGEFYPTFVYYDEVSRRMVGSTKVYKHTADKAVDLSENDEVDLTIGTPFDLGYTVIINKAYLGMLYKSDVFQPLEEGRHLKGYIKKVRPDGKIDVSLRRPGDHKLRKQELSEQIVTRLKEENGFIAVTDKSRPELISTLFGVSKREFKEAVGNLYRRKIIRLEKNGIRLLSKD